MNSNPHFLVMNSIEFQITFHIKIQFISSSTYARDYLPFNGWQLREFIKVIWMLVTTCTVKFTIVQLMWGKTSALISVSCCLLCRVFFRFATILPLMLSGHAGSHLKAIQLYLSNVIYSFCDLISVCYNLISLPKRNRVSVSYLDFYFS